MNDVREVTVRLGPGQYAVIVSDELASQYRVWSPPVEVMVEPHRGDHDILDMTFRAHECPEPLSRLLP